MASAEPSSYINYETLTSDSFSPTAYANSLVLATNDASDTPLDLSTPLSRVLFDVQETDTHIDTLTTTNAVPLITTIQTQTSSSTHLLTHLESHLSSLQESYARLEREVTQRHAAADQVRLAATRMIHTLRLGRNVQRVAQLGRQLEGQMEDAGGTAAAKDKSSRGMVGASQTLLQLRQVFTSASTESEPGLERISIVQKIRGEVVGPAERNLVTRAQQVVREFSMSSLLAPGGNVTTGGRGEQTFAQSEEMKSRAVNALQTLYLLSPIKSPGTTSSSDPGPTLLISALNSYLQTALTSSLAALSRALATLSTLDRALLEISARCQNIVALESLLQSTTAIPHPLSPPTSSSEDSNFLTPLLRHLDTSSLPSYFWRSMASQMSSRVQEILSRGGASARTLRSNRERVREMVRECVDRGSRLPFSSRESGGGKKGGGGGGQGTNWEREAAVMVSSVVGPLMRG